MVHGLSAVRESAPEPVLPCVGDVEPVQGARIEPDESAWDRVGVYGTEHDHTWVRKGQEVRTAAITVSTASSPSFFAQ